MQVTATVQAIPEWAMPDAPYRNAIHEVAALAGFENQWVRLSAADQRRLMGLAVFGKQAIKVCADGAIEVARSICFGNDYEIGYYTPDRVHLAALHRLRISPGTYGPGFAN